MQSLYGKSTTTDILLTSDLHVRMIRNRFTANLLGFAESVREEIEFALEAEFPLDQGDILNFYWSTYLRLTLMVKSIDQWTSVKICHSLLHVVAGTTSRAMSGTLLCRDRRWMSTCIGYIENIFITMLTLRLFPRVLHQLISIFLPSSWMTYFYLRRCKKVLIPIIEERLEAQKSPSTAKPLDLLQCMIEGAEGDDVQPERLARLLLMVNLAAIHTSSMAIIHAIYDLCEHQEYVKVLREEVDEVLRADGGWQKGTHKKLHKIDSFLKESQRFSPPTLCGLVRFLHR